MRKKSLISTSSSAFFQSKQFLIILVAFFSVLYFTSLFFKSSQNTNAQQVVTLGTWHTSSPFQGDGSPYGSFVRNGVYYVNTTYTTGNAGQKQTFMGTPDGSGNITTWTKAWDGHGGTHGFASATVQWSATEQKVFMLRNGHIGEYYFHPDGTIGKDVYQGNVLITDYNFWGNETAGSGIKEPFDGRLFVWDSIVFAPLSTGKYIYEMGGFSCPGHGCVNTCTDAGCSSANIDYKNNGNIYYQKIPFVHWSASEQYYKFKYTGTNHPDWKETQDNVDAPGKSVFYAPNGGGADYGFIYVTHNRAVRLYHTRVNSDGTLGNWVQDKDLLPAINSSQGGYDRGDLFVIGNTLFVARGKRVYSAPLDPNTGAVGAWDDTNVPDLPDDQVRAMGWGKDNEGSMWGIIGNYVYLTGQNAVYYASITGAPATTPTSVTSTTPTVPPPTPTPLPSGTCSSGIPSITSPQEEGKSVSSGKNTFSWSKVQGTKTYSVHIDDMTNGWIGDCTAAQNAGDICKDVDANTTSVDFTAEEGHSYHMWVQSVNYCGTAGTAAERITHDVPPVDANSCRIQGYKVVVGPVDQSTLKTFDGYYIDSANANNSESIWVPDSIKSQQITVAGAAAIKTYQYNPYFITVPANQTYTVSTGAVSGYNIYSKRTLEKDPALQCSKLTQENSSSSTFNCPAGQVVKLWWYYVPTSQPTPNITQGVSPTPTPTPASEASYCKPVDGVTTDPITMAANKWTKHDVIILPDAYDDPATAMSDAMSDAKAAVDRIRSTNIGAENFAKMNFWINTNLSKKYNVQPGCGTNVGGNSAPCWDVSKESVAAAVQQICGGDSYLIIHNVRTDKQDEKEKTYGVAYMGGMKAMIYSNHLSSAPHELCHSIAGCDDEYVYYKNTGSTNSPTYVPVKSTASITPAYNCANESTCSKWTKKAGCISGCDYADWYRSVQCSIMYSAFACPDFSDPATVMWSEALKKYL